MKILDVIKKLFIGALAVVFFGFVIIMTILLLNYNEYGVTQIDNTTFIKIREEISSDNYNKGDLVLVKSKKLENINVGDELFVYQVDSDGVVTIDLGTVGEIHSADEAISFENGDTYAEDFIIGKATKVYNKIGTILSIIESKFGFLFIVLIPSFLVFIYTIYSLIIEIKYGNEEVEN